MLKAKIAPSMLSSDFAALADESKRMKDCGAHLLHMDVMDGHFVPNLTLGAPIIKCLRKHTDMFLDKPADLIALIKATGMKVGIAVKPKTSVESVIPFCKAVDMILIMTVEPGFGGQKMMPDCLEKVKVLRSKFPQLDIQVDGGIDVSNIEQVAAAGANVIVAGTGVFGHKSPAEAISIMTKAVEKNLK
ncbi:hypothetical protein HK103_003180 [Boothiomyces macroporosus]|uniref:Ribulose-phosphate 3-epimerase n=1 Tax=Boothiomyces macroporosus TaxID=261099 RepID=A0AAD5UCN9_9FUNG|nr:hypothetical protein HK103_003180 [Boothiomyces macroporosus]